MALRFDWRLRGTAGQRPVKFQSHILTFTIDLAASRIDEIWEGELSFLQNITRVFLKNSVRYQGAITWNNL